MDNQTQLPKVIRASAGTGKTYRLSLEFIGLLLKFQNSINFEEIVVITFTRKATSEIRQRIISFLYRIVHQTEDFLDLQNCLSDFYPEITLDDNARVYLAKVYKKIITNKSKLNISTLDSFINQIFRSLIAPYYNISDYDIDPFYNDNILPHLYNVLLTDKNYHLLENIFKTTRDRDISSYDNFIKTILEQRWLFEFYDRAGIQEVQPHGTSSEIYLELTRAAADFCRLLTDFIASEHPQKSVSDIFNSDWKSQFKSQSEVEYLSPQIIYSILLKMLTDENFLIDQRSLVSSSKPSNIWNARKLTAGKKYSDIKVMLAESQSQFFELWNNYLFYKLAIPEQQTIFKIARLIYKKYDQIKFQHKVFTYSDLAFYTFSSLYDPDISLIHQGEVLNIFYEQLSYRIRFILIDEFQDTSILQWNIFAPLIKELVAGYGSANPGSLIIVGDEKQSIYGWRSGERDLLKNMEKMLPCRFQPTDPLTDSWRSSKAVVNLVNAIFNCSLFKEKTEPLLWQYNTINAKKDTPGFCHLQFDNRFRSDNDLEFEDSIKKFISESLQPALKNGSVSPGDTAILTRSHKEIESICSVLRDLGIDYINEAGNSLLQHRAIAPLIYLLRWLNNFDLYNLVRFLRSDLVLITSSELKNILNLFNNFTDQKSAFYLVLYNKFQHLPAIACLPVLHSLRTQPLTLIKEAVKAFNLIKIFPHETDLVNIQKFMDICAEFSRQLEYSQNLTGLLRFLEENQDSELFAQAEIQKQAAIKVLSIHKSKGLEFDTVILMLKSPSGHAASKNLSIFPDFNDSYSELSAAFFTYNFASLLRYTTRQQLFFNQEIKDKIEEINLWYVALTRAKRNLMLLYVYKNAKGISGFLKDYDKDKLNTSKLMVDVILQLYADRLAESPHQHSIAIGELTQYHSDSQDNIVTIPSSTDVSGWFDPLPDSQLTEKENWRLCLNPADLAAQTKAKQTGSIAHFYLQQIVFDSPRQRQMALDNTIAFYGSLIPAAKLKALCHYVNRFLDDHHRFFDPLNWDAAFCEYPVFDQYGRVYRIDRLLVSHQRRELLILDYKTGKTTDQAQLDRYKEIVQSIPFVKNNKYIVKPGIFLKINLV